MERDRLRQAGVRQVAPHHVKMGLVDFILNLAGILLWINWRSAAFDPLARATPATLAGTLRRASSASTVKRWLFPIILVALLFVRAVFYWQIGAAVRWTASVNLASISVSFRSDEFWRMLVFSVLSFGEMLGIFFLWLLLLSLLQRSAVDTNPLQRMVRVHLGRLHRWPRWVKALLPFIAVTGIWWVLSWPLTRWDLLPPPVSGVHRIEQALVVGLGSYLAWEYLIVTVLVLYLAGSYVYFGNHPLWNYVNDVAHQFMWPIRWLPLRFGKIDFAPVVGIALVFVLARLVEGHLALGPHWRIPGLRDLYQRLPL